MSVMDIKELGDMENLKPDEMADILHSNFVQIDSWSSHEELADKLLLLYTEMQRKPGVEERKTGLSMSVSSLSV